MTGRKEHHMKRETRYELKYRTKDGYEKVCYPKSEESKDRNLAYCREKGIKVISCKKLYPFSTMKNQHNFDLIHSICYNRMHDMQSGEAPWDDEEYTRLEQMKEDAERFFSLDLPVAWLPWEDWKKANELAQNAIVHRQEACIANGRPDLVTYC